MRETKYQLLVLTPHRELLSLEEVASFAGVHPNLVQRFLDFGLIERAGERAAGILFEPEVIHRIRVIQRLRGDLGINLQGIGVILDLLDRLKATKQGGDRGYQ